MKNESLAECVKSILTYHLDSRDDDALLIYLVIDYSYNVKAGILHAPLFNHLFFSDVMQNYSYWGLPSFESIIRAKRKIQHECPNLRPTEKRKNKKGD